MTTNTNHKSALALMGKESCVTRQSVFVLLVSPSSLQFVSLNISGGLCVTQCKWGSVCDTQCVSLNISGGFVCVAQYKWEVCVCHSVSVTWYKWGFVCHSVRVTTLIIAAASGFPQELTGQVMQPPLRSSHPSDDTDLTKYFAFCCQMTSY